MLSQQEVARLLDAAPGLKYKAALSVAYGAGLRARACHAAAQLAEIDKRVSLHTLRHSFATHLLEHNTDIRVIQVRLGHAKLENTALYTRVATKTISEVVSPLEHIAQKLKSAEPPT